MRTAVRGKAAREAMPGGAYVNARRTAASRGADHDVEAVRGRATGPTWTPVADLTESQHTGTREEGST